MNCAGIISNIDKDKELKLTKKMIEYLKQKGLKVLFDNNISEKLYKEKNGVNIKEIYKNSDFLVALGGDGTILKCIPFASIYNRPILGINLGTLGFLMEVPKEKTLQAIDKILNDEYEIEERQLIEATVNDFNNNNSKLTSLNEFYIKDCTYGKVVQLCLYINNKLIDCFVADGIIISTPTGSTAYNLSSGGPILTPTCKNMIITPICAHSLYTRPLVVSEQDEVKIVIGETRSNKMFLNADGKKGYSLYHGSVVTIKKSKYNLKLIRTEANHFFDVYRKCLIERK